MAIKYYTNPEKRQTIAVLSGTKWDAINRIDKLMDDTGLFVMGSTLSKYCMPDTFKVVVTCDERDEFDVEVGKQVAKRKLMRNYYKSLDKRLAKFKKFIDGFHVKMGQKNF